MNYPAFHPGTDEGIGPILRFLLRPEGEGCPVAVALKGFARRPEGVGVFLEAAIDPPGAVRWRILVSDCIDFGFLEEPVRTVCVLREHPVLWRHRRPEMELSAAGTVRDPEGALAALIRAHEKEVHAASQGLGARWILPEQFAGDLRRVGQLLRGGGGQVARGPERLLQAYAKALDRAGAATSLLSLPGRWSKGKSRPKPPLALFLGESFAVGTALNCRQL